MRKTLSLLALLSVLTGVLVACGATSEPTEPPTQTPQIIVFTPTPLPTITEAVKPTLTPTVAAATPTKAPTVATEPVPSTTAGPAATEPETGELEATTEPGGEPTQTLTPEPPTPTDTPGPGARYPAPVLLDPPSNRSVPWRGSLTLIWSPVGELKEDEYYVLKLERRPQTETQTWWGDEVFLKETKYVLRGDFLAPFHYSADHGHAVVYWWVRIVHKTGEAGGKPVGRDISEPSEERTLILDPKPEGE